jgi:hypothetical protein
VVARKLKSRYLWIDCYCIIQSEEEEPESEEKLAEISRMGEIYSISIINIGAGAAKSPLDGFFVRKVRPSALAVEFTSKSQKMSSTYHLYDASVLENNEPLFFQHKQNSILNRAWCMQERFLCSHMLHFSALGMFWECRAMEVGSNRLPTQAYPIRREGPNYLPFSILKDDETPRHENLND